MDGVGGMGGMGGLGGLDAERSDPSTPQEEYPSAASSSVYLWMQKSAAVVSMITTWEALAEAWRVAPTATVTVAVCTGVSP